MGLLKANQTSFKKGFTPWNKGKKGVMPTAWNKGIYGNKLSYITRKKIGLAGIGRKTTIETRKKLSKSLKGRIISDEWKKKLSNSHKGQIAWNKGLKGVSFETSKKMREAKILRPNKVFKDTSIELKVENELRIRKIDYQKQVSFCKVAVVDFYLPKHNLIIQVDGCYWHNCPIHSNKILKGKTERDLNQDKILKENGYIVSRFWEHEINESVEKCINKLNLKI